jgi:hypothetical protein
MCKSPGGLSQECEHEKVPNLQTQTRTCNPSRSCSALFLRSNPLLHTHSHFAHRGNAVLLPYAWGTERTLLVAADLFAFHPWMFEKTGGSVSIATTKFRNGQEEADFRVSKFPMLPQCSCCMSTKPTSTPCSRSVSPSFCKHTRSSSLLGGADK